MSLWIKGQKLLIYVFSSNSKAILSIRFFKMLQLPILAQSFKCSWRWHTKNILNQLAKIRCVKSWGLFSTYDLKNSNFLLYNLFLCSGLFPYDCSQISRSIFPSCLILTLLSLVLCPSSWESTTARPNQHLCQPEFCVICWDMVIL